MNDNLAVAVHNGNQNVTVFETIDAIAKAGFKKVFVQWYNNKEWNYSQEEQLKYINKKGLNVIFAHLEYKNINDIWLSDKKGDEVLASYLNDLDVIKKHNIPMVIMHLTRKEEAPPYNKIGLKRLQTLADYAQKINIKIAFENTKIKDYLEYVIENINNSNVGICFDSGHYHCHFKDEFDFRKFKNRIFAVHFHDNDGQTDQHLLPLDGTTDWDVIIKGLISANYQAPITLELCYRNAYIKMSIEEFYQKAYEIGQEIVKKINEEKENNMNKIIAIDGPAGSGKGTLAKALAEKLNLVNIDTGATYRCVALKVLRNKVKIDDQEKIIDIAKNINIDLLPDGKVILDGEDVTKEIRSKEVTEIVSPISSIVKVRELMVDVQRKIAEGKDVVMEGRDITTVVFPNAKYKFYLDASVESRAERRYKENQEKGIDMTYEEVYDNIVKRDYNDMHKEVGSLMRTDDQIYIDTTNLTVQEEVEIIEKVVNGE